METRVFGATREVVIGGERPTVLIGERINPAGKKKLSEALRSGNMDFVRRLAQAQVAAGADIIDINVSMFGIDEAKLLPQVVREVGNSVDVPLCLDSANTEALEAALKVCPGRPIINSVTGERSCLQKILPLVREYGTPVIGLAQDGAALPREATERVAIACRIVNEAKKAGIPRENLIIDCLALAVGADADSGQVTLETIRRVKSELGVNVVLGASNISFGMPERNRINGVFAAMAISAGATCLIADVMHLRSAALAVDLILGRDKHGRRYIADYRKRQKEAA
jgi:5-methyltetrahydrofolate--homocysteine methyltransferase